ncbi:hypothetical protein LVJ94_48300 [Pendulispora rubella]|uniref:DNA primase n=1 Tax=Pendulispora rubella TaxID=2741070 RepID=A0ABZ2L173_9BACT
MPSSTKRRRIVVSVLSALLPSGLLALGCTEMTTANPFPPIEAGVDATEAASDVRAADAVNEADAVTEVDAGNDGDSGNDGDAGDGGDAGDANDGQ